MEQKTGLSSLFYSIRTINSSSVWNYVVLEFRKRLDTSVSCLTTAYLPMRGNCLTRARTEARPVSSFLAFSLKANWQHKDAKDELPCRCWNNRGTMPRENLRADHPALTRFSAPLDLRGHDPFNVDVGRFWASLCFLALYPQLLSTVSRSFCPSPAYSYP